MLVIEQKEVNSFLFKIKIASANEEGIRMSLTFSVKILNQKKLKILIQHHVANARSGMVL